MAEQSARQRIVLPFTGNLIGQGFNSDTAERVGTGLDAADIGEDPFASGQTADFRFRMVTSQTSLEEALNIGAEVEARYGLFSGGAKFDFAQSQAINSSSTYIVASALISNALRSGSGFTPNATASALIAAGDKEGFKQAFGDRFCEALHTGGEFHALVPVTSSSTEHQQKISASLHAELNGLFTSGSFEGSLQDAQKDTSSHTEVTIEVHQTSGVGEQVQIPGTEADSIREHMNRFAIAAHENAQPYKAELVTYDTLALPFPRPEEVEDRRRVLEDCLARRQVYWSAISDLTFAQSAGAQLIFDDLPPPEQLVDLQNDFRQILNDLMAHARAVSSGAIPPTFFVAEAEPPLPRFKRRNASRFATWWVRRNDPDLLQSEKFLVQWIGEEASTQLTVPLEEASPETVERAAEQITDLSQFSPVAFGDNSELTSMASLPSMIDAPLREIFCADSGLEELSGLEPFSRLEELTIFRSNLRDIQAVASVAGLRHLSLQENNILDLSPLRALTRLESLFVSGNRIESLEPLRELHALRSVLIHRTDTGDNPIADARALSSLPHLANRLTSADDLRLTLCDLEALPLESGLATRIGDSNRFQYTSDSGVSEQILLSGLREFKDISVFAAPAVLAGMIFRDRPAAAVMCTRPDDRSASLPAGDVAEIRVGPGGFGIGTLAKPVIGGGFLDLLLEATPA